jgi:hypothetical protein
MNRFYYSNFCPHSKDVLDFIRRNNLIQSLEFFCVDSRFRDPRTGILYILSKDSQRKDPLPPNIQEVPALLLVREQYRLILGKEIMNYFAPHIKNVFSEIHTPEPSSLSHDSQNFSSYGDSLTTVGYIQTPPEDRISSKIGENITIDLLEKHRHAELEKITSSHI